jgi:hypothetical protein
MNINNFLHIAKDFNLSEDEFKYLIDSYLQEVFYYLGKDIRISTAGSHVFGMDMWTLYQRVFEKYYDLDETKTLRRNHVMFKAHKDTYYGKTKKDSIIKKRNGIKKRKYK